MKAMTAAIFILSGVATEAQTKWNVDASHSKMGFSVTHMMVSETEGKFKIYQGSVNSVSAEDFTDAKVSFTVQTASINTDDEKRDAHLKSADFFDVEKHPTMQFVSTSVKKGKEKNTYIITGELTIKGVTKTVTLTGVHSGKTVKDPWGMQRTGFSVKGSIKRSDFGLTWNALLEAGGVAVSDEVAIQCTIELIKA